MTPPVLMRWLKGSTARAANRILGRTGQAFWQDESFDHYLRSSTQIERTIAYIEGNAASAGIADSQKPWRWSSAGWKMAGGNVCPTLLPESRASAIVALESRL